MRLITMSASACSFSSPYKPCEYGSDILFFIHTGVRDVVQRAERQPRTSSGVTGRTDASENGACSKITHSGHGASHGTEIWDIVTRVDFTGTSTLSTAPTSIDLLLARGATIASSSATTRQSSCYERNPASRTKDCATATFAADYQSTRGSSLGVDSVGSSFATGLRQARRLGWW
jgi:hypothetical protein